MKIVAIIQARMQSSRLPGKILADLAGRPLLVHVVERARRIRPVDSVILATSDHPADDPVMEFCATNNIDCFRGSENDVLDRYYQTARQYQADTIVRITADCPLLDPQVSSRVVAAFLDGQYDYASNCFPPTWPDGLDTEVFTFAALDTAWREADMRSQREHVTSFITGQPKRFRLGNVRAAEDNSHHRWTVDEPQDLEFVRSVYRHCGPGTFDTQDVLDLLNVRPELAAINAGFERNEGYLKSLLEDTRINNTIK